MGFVTAISNFFGAISDSAKLLFQRTALKNTPSQQANAEAKELQADKDQAAKDINSADLTQLEKDTAE